MREGSEGKDREWHQIYIRTEIKAALQIVRAALGAQRR